VLTLMVGGKWGVVRFFVGILLLRGVLYRADEECADRMYWG
jgi:hypothetical protein